MTDRTERLALSVDEAAEAAGLSRRFIYDEMKRGRLEFAKVGTRRLILREDLVAYLRRAREAA